MPDVLRFTKDHAHGEVQALAASTPWTPAYSIACEDL